MKNRFMTTDNPRFDSTKFKTLYTLKVTQDEHNCGLTAIELAVWCGVNYFCMASSLTRYQYIGYVEAAEDDTGSVYTLTDKGHSFLSWADSELDTDLLCRELYEWHQFGHCYDLWQSIGNKSARNVAKALKISLTKFHTDKKEGVLTK